MNDTRHPMATYAIELGTDDWGIVFDGGELVEPHRAVAMLAATMRKADAVALVGRLVREAISIRAQAEYLETMCECEADWNCPMHANRIGTFIETRYAGLDSAEAIAHGRWEDA